MSPEQGLPIEERLLQMETLTALYGLVINRLIMRDMVTEEQVVGLLTEIGGELYRDRALRRVARQYKIPEDRRQSAVVRVLERAAALPLSASLEEFDRLMEESHG